MPTPFSHLVIAQRLLIDEQVPEAMRDLLHTERSAFLLGNVAADARVDAAMGREVTHFHTYTEPIRNHLWRLMMVQHPSLENVHQPAHLAFMAGYVAHLSMDETWTLNLVRPHVMHGEWNGAGFYERFLALHLILTYMDERDLPRIEDWQADCLPLAQPERWLPFLPDNVLRDWRDFISLQIAPDGESKTLDIFGSRIGLSPEDFRSILDSPQKMHASLWQYLPPDRLAAVEPLLYTSARQQMIDFLSEHPGTL